MAEADLLAAAKHFRDVAKLLERHQPLLKEVEKLLARLDASPGKRAAKAASEAQTTPAKRVTEQPNHAGQLPSKSNRT